MHVALGTFYFLSRSTDSMSLDCRILRIIGPSFSKELPTMTLKVCDPSHKDGTLRYHYWILLCFLRLWYNPPVVKFCLSNNITSQNLWGNS